MGFGGDDKPTPPPPPPVPQAPPPPPSTADRDAQEALERIKAQQRQARGHRANVVAGAQGLLSSTSPSRRVLLGGS